MPREDWCTIDCRITGETDKAWRMVYGLDTFWMPKKLVFAAADEPRVSSQQVLNLSVLCEALAEKIGVGKTPARKTRAGSSPPAAEPAGEDLPAPVRKLLQEIHTELALHYTTGQRIKQADALCRRINELT